MSNEQVIFCGNSDRFLKKELTEQSNEKNGGIAFRTPSLISANGTLIAAIDRQTCGKNWGYIEPAVRRSEDGGETWSDIESVAKPPARETRITADSYASAFFSSPCMAVAPNGDVIMLINFWPECKGLHNKKILDKKKTPYAHLNGRMRPLIYDRDGNFYYIAEDGSVLDNRKNPTPYRVENALGSLYKDDEYVGNIHLNGAMGKNEAAVETTFGAPLKAPKRSYIFMLRSTDNGKTWSEPQDITNMILCDDDGVFLGVSPGTGITTADGRIIMPLYTDEKGSVSVYSVDNGETWHRMTSQLYAENTDKWQIVEAPDGTLIGFGQQKRYGKTPISASMNKGKNWIKNGTTSLVAPNCKKSVIAFGSYVFASHPSGKERENGVISVGKLRHKKASYTHIDWVSEIEINQGFFAYSSLALIDENTIGVLYEDEPSSHIVFKKFSLSDLI